MAKKKASREGVRKRGARASLAAVLRELALGFPEAWEDFPWGHPCYKVRKKIFVTMANEGHVPFTVSVKLPRSGREALLLPFAEPTHYGMGKHGWVTFSFDDPRSAPLELLRGWIDESYRAIAPKTLVKQLDG